MIRKKTKLIGAFADVKSSKISAYDIQQQIKSNEEKISGIPNRLGEMGLSNQQVDSLINFKFPSSKKYLQRFFDGQSHINPESVFELLQNRYALAYYTRARTTSSTTTSNVYATFRDR
jgi:hypothetical protein